MFGKQRFNIIGYSQGGLIARYIAETCETKFPVNNLLTLGGPHMGIDAIPHCESGLLCELINDFFNDLIEFKDLQFIAPMGYLRDV